MFVLAGLGLNPPESLSAEVVKAVRTARFVFLETYTSPLRSLSALEKKFGKKIRVVDRQFVEEGRILEYVRKGSVVLLVPGDPLAATTHSALLVQCRELGVPTRVLHNASVFNAVLDTGLAAYKFGRTTIVARWTTGFHPVSFYDVIAENKRAGLHSLVLLDTTGGAMRADEALRLLLDVEKERKKKAVTPNTRVVVCERLGTASQKIRRGRVNDFLHACFGRAPHCLIFPGRFAEVEAENLSTLAEPCPTTRRD